MKRLEKISCHNFIETKGYIFFSNWFYNGLFKVKSTTGETTFLGCFEDEEISERNIHRELMLKEEKIYFMPGRGRCMHIYNLSNQIINSIEIKKNSDPPFAIKDVIQKENHLIFLPFKENHPIRQVNLTTLEVKDIGDKTNLEGEYLSEKKEAFPKEEFEKKYDIEEIDFSSWRKMENGKWCTFSTRRSQMLWYEGISKLEMIPLIVVNQRELKEYLYRVERAFWRERAVQESEIIGIKELGEKLARGQILNYDNVESNENVGNKIWKMLEKNNTSFK